MGQELSTIEELVEFHALDTISLTSAEGLHVANLTLRALAGMAEWEDLIRQQTFTTTADQETYTFNFDPYYVNITALHVADWDDANKYKRVVPVRSELDWGSYENAVAGFPEVYRFLAERVLHLRPKPKYGSKNIRFTGVIEPEKFTSGTSRTPFHRAYDDDTLAMLIAAYYRDQRMFPFEAAQLYQKVSQRLASSAGKEILPAEVKARVLA